MATTTYGASAAATGGGSLTLPKAQIINIDSGEIIECMFNPKEYSISKRNNWGQPKSGGGASSNAGTNVPKQQYSGGNPATLTLQLLFDTYAGATGSQDVRKQYTSKIWALAEVDPTFIDNQTTKSRPPKVRFQWGPAWSFVAVITSITQKFTLFSSNGTPVRATLDVTFQQITDDSQLPGTNPTSGGTGGERQWTVKHGDTLASIAYEAYGDAARWRAIADANHLTAVRDLRPGLQLGIPTRA
jgi:Contractile injection system tube protein/LysM domain